MAHRRVRAKIIKNAAVIYMPTFDLYSKRQKRIRGEVPDVFQYEDIPKAFRVQVIHIIRDAFGHYSGGSQSYEVFKSIHDILCREYGLFHLSQEAPLTGNYQAALFNFFLNCEDIEKVLDVIELSFKGVNGITRDSSYRYNTQPSIEPDEAIKELNIRFLEHGIGYQFEAGELMRVDSKLVHAEVVKPALKVLSDKRYAGANEEFLKAHEHYRHGRYKECLNECLKAFESTIKAICDKRSWQYSNSDTAKKLIDICLQKGLIPSYLQSQFTALRASLESGIPTVRNKLSGHGQGTQQANVPRYMAAYLLHLTATSILFLTDAEKELP